MNQAVERTAGTAKPPAGPPKAIGPLARRERNLAYSMLLPTFAIVMAVVLAPLLANFWISFKPVGLGDLRAATLFVNERMRGDLEAPGDTATLEYRLRNSSQDKPLRDVSFTDTLPEGLSVTGDTDPRCSLEGRELRCVLGEVEARFRDTIRIEVTVEQAYIDNPVAVRASEAIPQVTSDNVLTNFEFTLENFDKVFSASEFWHVMRVTVYYTVFATLGAIILGLFAAQILNTAFAGRTALRGLFLFPYVAPVIAVAFTWVLLLDPFSGAFNAILRQIGAIEQPINFLGQRAVPVDFFGLRFNFPVALTTIIMIEAWRSFPLSFLFILARMQSISADLYEAAEMDGASPLQQFWYISLPQLVGILAILFLLRFIWSFNNFDDIFLLTGGAAGTRTLTVNVYEQAFAISNLGAGAAVAVVVFLVLLCFSIVIFKYSPRDEG
ncbi:carbohydrate ABC transporter permease [Oricola thermophila]|uniref:Sugar ABC transporter permease n=1 Tax=Oricola thermophila TaxID=2742145 RepID=A0A6N1VGN0_9HYPH|nr:sugar ABC transporter permease [Oricola thermophila]QKV20076.1 sugar ABC transporter permease [Oricola thermophila]